jgi:PAT family beta-lactamase induction signal transducer AmpG
MSHTPLAAPATAPTAGRPLPRWAWVSTTYFAEGLPYMIVRYLAGVYLTDIGVKELYLGFLNFLALPWNLKFLWAPTVDIFGTKRGWLIKVEAALVVLMVLMGLCAWGGPPVISPAQASAGTSAAAVASLAIRLLVLALVIGAFLAATHDVAIDAYYMEAITDPGEQAAFTGLRIMTYRFAVVFTRSVLVATAAWLSWRWSFFGAALTLAVLVVFHMACLPRLERPRAPQSVPMRELLRRYGSSFVSWLDQPRILLVMLFIITYKLGDEVLFSMHTPFLMRGLGIPKTDLAWMQGILGTAANILGSLLCAWAIRRFGLKRAIWPLTLGMNLNIWVYVWLAWVHPDPRATSGLGLIAVILAYEQFAGGLGNGVIMVYAMRICKPAHKAAHFAIATAMQSLAGTLCGGFGGVIVERVGYMWLFVLAFVAALPSMGCLIFLPLHEHDGPNAAAESRAG